MRLCVLIFQLMCNIEFRTIDIRFHSISRKKTTNIYIYKAMYPNRIETKSVEEIQCQVHFQKSVSREIKNNNNNN